MSEEEKELIDGYFNKGWCCDLDEVYNVVIKLEDLYQKEKEKNKKLIDGQIETLEKILAPKLLEKFISKDKIIEKIEEYEEILQSSIIKEDYKKEVEHIIRVLEELKGE